MCSASPPKAPPPPPPRPDFKDEVIALSTDVQRDRLKQMFAGLSSTISGGSAGVLNPTRTTAGVK